VPLSFRAIKGFGHFPHYGRSENPRSDFSGRTFCQLAPQKDDYQSAILIIVFFWGAKSLIARKDRGSARVGIAVDFRALSESAAADQSSSASKRLAADQQVPYQTAVKLANARMI